MVQLNPSSIIVSAHHYVLKDTTVASGEWEGMQRDEKGHWTSHYHGYFPQGYARRAPYPGQDSQRILWPLSHAPHGPRVVVDLWLGAHTHTRPDDTFGGKSHIERRWGVTFINAAGLTRYHGPPQNQVPRSWLLTFTVGSREITAQCYLHGDEFAPQGWYPKAERKFALSKPFEAPSDRE